MKQVLLVATVLFLAAREIVAQCEVDSSCSNSVQYDKTFLPACEANDIYVKWPNYADPLSYYVCNGVNTPVLTKCASGTYFTYVLQKCTSCDNYIPAPPCEYLKTQSKPNCIALVCTTTTTTTTTTTAATTTTTKAPVTETTTKSTTTKSTTTPAVTTTTQSSVVQPPVESTNSPDVPTPSSEAPTPPNLDVTPPTIS